MEHGLEDGLRGPVRQLFQAQETHTRIAIGFHAGRVEVHLGLGGNIGGLVEHLADHGAALDKVENLFAAHHARHAMQHFGCNASTLVLHFRTTQHGCVHVCVCV